MVDLYKLEVEFHLLVLSTIECYVPGTVLCARDIAKHKIILALKNYSLSVYEYVC